MKCMKCNNDFPENEIQESHDVPCYLFEGKKRNARKDQADKFGRHHLCKECHEKYEFRLFSYLVSKLTPGQKRTLIIFAKKFSIKYFGEVDATKTTMP